MSTHPLHADSLMPNITATDIDKSIHFYTHGLGFQVATRSERDGVLTYVVLRAGNAQLGLGRDDFAKGRNRSKGVGLRIWLSTTQDITALAAHAASAGITIDEGPAPLPWGPMAFAVTDPDGFKLTISAPMTM